MSRSSRFLLLSIISLCLVLILVLLPAVAKERSGTLLVSFLNVGQGDATLIQAPSGRQVLIDGGPDTSVLARISEELPWYDRTIDVMIATHPDADHIAGLVDVLERYKVDTVVVSSVKGETALAATFEKRVAEEGAHLVVAERGQVLNLGRDSYIEILFPDRNLPNVETNVGCVVSKVVYKNTSFMLPCDTTMAVEQYLARLDGERLDADVLKAAHHGSKTSSAPIFVGYVSPQFAVYSRGCKNSYGHPHAQTAATYARFDIPTLDTCDEGTITFVSDGQTVRRR